MGQVPALVIDGHTLADSVSTAVTGFILLHVHLAPLTEFCN